MGEIIDPEFNCGSRNRGNFLEIISSFCVHDKVIKEKLNGPRNTQYIHHSIQDSILSILANSVRGNSRRTKDSEIFFFVYLKLAGAVKPRLAVQWRLL